MMWKGFGKFAEEFLSVWEKLGWVWNDADRK
jgi:hypothetical protein